MSNKLYKINFIGLYNPFFVVAENTEKALRKAKLLVDRHNLGSDKDRELKSIELIAEEILYPNCGNVLCTAE